MMMGSQMKMSDPHDRKNIFLFTDSTSCKLKTILRCCFFAAEAAQSENLINLQITQAFNTHYHRFANLHLALSQAVTAAFICLILITIDILGKQTL